jgi:uncharacterized membrane protein YfcA
MNPVTKHGDRCHDTAPEARYAYALPLAMHVSAHALALLLPAAFAAGVIDAIAGGGGLITLPALLAVGLPPHAALGTNKGQAVFGSATALFRYARAGLVHGARARVAFPAGLAGSLLGAQLVLFVAPSALRPLVLVLLVAAAIAVALRPSRPPARVHSPHHARLAAIGIGAAIGMYDGFFGPGTGTFLIVAFVFVFGADLARASADAKVVNFASNLAAVVLFAQRGVIVWALALPMAAAQLAGAWLGAHMVVHGGERFVRVILLFVVLALVLKLALDVVRG